MEPNSGPLSSYKNQFPSSEVNSIQRQQETEQLKSENLRKRQANFILGYEYSKGHSENAG